MGFTFGSARSSRRVASASGRGPRRTGRNRVGTACVALEVEEPVVRCPCALGHVGGSGAFRRPSGRRPLEVARRDRSAGKRADRRGTRVSRPSVRGDRGDRGGTGEAGASAGTRAAISRPSTGAETARRSSSAGARLFVGEDGIGDAGDAVGDGEDYARTVPCQIRTPVRHVHAGFRGDRSRADAERAPNPRRKSRFDLDGLPSRRCAC